MCKALSYKTLPHVIPLLCNFKFLDSIPKLVAWKKLTQNHPFGMYILFSWHNDSKFTDILNYITLVAKYHIQDSEIVLFDNFPAFLKNSLTKGPSTNRPPKTKLFVVSTESGRVLFKYSCMHVSSYFFSLIQVKFFICFSSNFLALNFTSQCNFYC